MATSTPADTYTSESLTICNEISNRPTKTTRKSNTRTRGRTHLQWFRTQQSHFSILSELSHSIISSRICIIFVGVNRSIRRLSVFTDMRQPSTYRTSLTMLKFDDISLEIFYVYYTNYWCFTIGKALNTHVYPPPRQRCSLIEKSDNSLIGSFLYG